MTVQVSLVAHFEWIEDVGHATWWADSPDVLGFYAAAPSLGELQREAPEALRWSMESEDVEVEWTTEDDVPEWAATHVAIHPEGLAHLYSSGAGPRTHQMFILLLGRSALGGVVPTSGSHNFSLLV